jgi:hypothetical protein
MPRVSSAQFRSLRSGQLEVTLAIAAGAFSILTGSVTAAQFCFGLAKFGGLEYAPRVGVISGVRVFGPATSTLAALLALLVWAHRLDADAVRPNLIRAAPRALVMALVATPITTALTVFSGFFVAHWIYDVPWHAIAASRSALTLGDISAAADTFVVNAALTGAFCWFVLPPMTRRGWSLFQKIGATWGLAILLRVIFEVAHAPSSLGVDKIAP